MARLLCLCYVFFFGALSPVTKAPAPLPRKIEVKRPIICHGYYHFYWGESPWLLYLHQDGRSLCQDKTGLQKYVGTWSYEELTKSYCLGILTLRDSSDHGATWNTWVMRIHDVEFNRKGKVLVATGKSESKYSSDVNVFLQPSHEPIRVAPTPVAE